MKQNKYEILNFTTKRIRTSILNDKGHPMLVLVFTNDNNYWEPQKYLMYIAENSEGWCSCSGLILQIQRMYKSSASMYRDLHNLVYPLNGY